MADSSSSDESKSSVVDDMVLLLECLKFQKDSITSQKQALTTLGMMCSTGSSKAKEVFRTSGCLEYVINLIQDTQSTELVQAGLCTLGCAAERDINTQIILSDREFFLSLNAILRSKETTLPLKSSVIFLLINVINSNIKGQRMAYETKVLMKLVDMFKTCIPSLNDDVMSIDCWSNVAKCLSCATDNPQNVLNQSQVTSTFPVAVNLLQSSRTIIRRPILTLLTSCVANNSKAQDRLHMSGGIHVLVQLLNSLLESEGELSLAISTIQALFAVATNNMVPLLLALLTRQELDNYQILSIIACLETLVETNKSHQKQFIEGQGETVLINVMAESRDDSICKAVPLIIKICRQKNCDIVPARGGPDTMLSRDPHIPGDDTSVILNELDSVPLVTKVNNWLERAEAESTNNIKETVNINEATALETSSCTSESTEYSRMKEKIASLENELQVVKEMIPDSVFKRPPQKEPITQYTCITSTPIQQDTTLIIPTDCTRPSSVNIRPTDCIRPSSITPYRPKATVQRIDLFQTSNRYTVQSNGVCPGCYGTVPPLNSRTLVPRLQQDTNTCTYHVQLVEDILRRVTNDTISPGLSIMSSLPLNNNNIENEFEITNRPLNTTNRPLNTTNRPLNTTNHPLNSISHPLNTTNRPLNTTKRPLNTTNCPLNTTNRPLNTTNHPLNTTNHPLNTTSHLLNNTNRPLYSLKSFQMSPIHPNVLKPLDNIINKQQYSISAGLDKRKKYNTRERRKPLYFLQEEVEFLLEGVKKLGPRWKHILRGYPFQKGRTATSLKDKYRLLCRHTK